jgi:dienelactone hydrolase
MRRVFVAIFALLASAAHAETVKIPWKGDYAHNGETVWSAENKYHKSGLTKNFMNGAPEENGLVQRDGILLGDLRLLQQDRPRSFVILMHGCSGATDPAVKRWAERFSKSFTGQGFGVLILDSFSTRHVRATCGPPNYHWGVRRAEDAYSALEYLVDNKLASPDDVFLVGRSNGALAAIMATEDVQIRNHQHRFAGSFAISPTCLGLEKSVFASPIVIFAGDRDDAAGDPKVCQSLNRPSGSPVRVIEFKGVTHGYEDEGAHHVFNGWRMEYNEKAYQFTLATITALIKTKDFQRGLEFK